MPGDGSESSASKAPASTEWGQYMTDIYKSRKPPSPLGTVVFAEIEEKAREVLKDHKSSWLYAYGSAGEWQTFRANQKIFESYRLLPRMLVNATVRDLETTIFGVKYSSPLLIAPIGVQGIFHPDGELAPATACKNLGVPFIMSTASSRSMEEVARANGDGHRWYQLYWPRSNDVTLSFLQRAKANNFSALIVTLDTTTIGWRPHDLETAMLPFAHGIGIQIGTSDPVFMARYGKTPVHERPGFPYVAADLDALYLAGDEKVREAVFLGMEFLSEMVPGTYHDWEDLKLIRRNWEGPLVLKGIQSAADAELAIDNGVDGIVVSNHGGRQIDGQIPTLHALVLIMKSAKVREAQAAGKFTVLFDSGIRTGSDILKAVALGAQGVLLGRPWLYGMIAGGQAGVEQVIRHTLADVHITLGLLGYKCLSDIQGKGEEVVTKLEL